MTPMARPADVKESGADHSPWEVPQGFWDDRHRTGTNGLARGPRGSPVAAPALAVAAIWTLLTAVKTILLVQQAHRAGLGMSAFQAWPAEIASLLGLLLALPTAFIAERASRSGAPPVRPLLLLVLGWGLFSLVHLSVTLGVRQATVGLDESYSFSTPRDWLLQLGESTIAYLVAMTVFRLFRPVPSREERAPGTPENVAPAGPGGPETDDVVRLLDSGREVEVGVRGLVAVSGGGNYIELVFRDGSRKLLRSTLNAAQAALEPIGFRRTHRSWLVLLDAVTDAARTASGDYRLDVGAGVDAPLSRRNRALLRELRARPSTDASHLVA